MNVLLNREKRSARRTPCPPAAIVSHIASFGVLGLGLASLLSPQPAIAQDPAPAHLVVTLGTSLTAADPDPQKNWQVALERGLEERLGEPVTVVNKGISGGSSQDGIQYVLNDAVALHPEVVTIEYAMNDA